MARKMPAKKAKKTSAVKPAARKSARKPLKKAAKKATKAATKPAKKAKKKAAPRPAARKAPIKKVAPRRQAATSAKATTNKSVGKPKKAAARKAAPKKAAPRTAPSMNAAPRKTAPSVPAKKPNLDRPRRTVADIRGIPSSLDMNRTASAAKSGRAEMQDKLAKSNSGGAALTAGDVDADWQSAEAVGDEAPGGDNPTPDQDVVDDIGRALGVEYEDDEELQGGAEISDRDNHRWELDPSSKDDFEDNE